jgi:hypothetical protein
VIDASASTQASGRMDKRRVMDVWSMAGRTLELKIQGRPGTAEQNRRADEMMGEQDFVSATRPGNG